MTVDEKERYFKMLEEAENNPEMMGVIISKKRNSGAEMWNKEYMSRKLKAGQNVAIQTINEDQKFADNLIGYLKKYHDTDAEYEKIYSTRLNPFEENLQERRFIGWLIKPINHENNTH